MEINHRYKLMNIHPSPVGVQLIAMGLYPGVVMQLEGRGLGGATYIMRVGRRAIVLDDVALSHMELTNLTEGD